MKKRAQVTLFIILGIVIVAGLVALFLFTRSIEENTPQKLGPKEFIDKCVRDVVEESTNEILASGGVLNPALSIMYNSSNYTYLCYQADLYKPCYNLYPSLRENIENTLVEDTEEDIKMCFDELREDFENRGYDVTGNGTIYDIELYPGEIRIKLKKSIKIVSGETAQNFENFNTKIYYPLDKILDTAENIIRDEILYCNFDPLTHMVLYPKERIEVILFNRSKIYRIEDRDTGIKFEFATRSCVRPIGIF